MTFREELIKFTDVARDSYGFWRDTFEVGCRDCAVRGKGEFSMFFSTKTNLYLERFAAEMGLVYFRKGDKHGVRWKGKEEV